VVRLEEVVRVVGGRRSRQATARPASSGGSMCSSAIPTGGTVANVSIAGPSSRGRRSSCEPHARGVVARRAGARSPTGTHARARCPVRRAREARPPRRDGASPRRAASCRSREAPRRAPGAHRRKRRPRRARRVKRALAPARAARAARPASGRPSPRPHRKRAVARSRELRAPR
jgi:hypothetical protein